MFISYRKPLLLFGPTGTGKSIFIKNYMMNKLSLDEYVPSFVTFTTQTSANFTQDLFLSKLIKRKRGVYGPPFGKVCVMFVDDMNMPAKDHYGSQPPIELLRQLFDHNHWYDLQDSNKVFLKDILLLSAMSPAGISSRQDVNARFLRHFGLFAINSFDDETITRIFSTLLQIGLKVRSSINYSVYLNYLIQLDRYKIYNNIHLEKWFYIGSGPNNRQHHSIDN